MGRVDQIQRTRLKIATCIESQEGVPREPSFVDGQIILTGYEPRDVRRDGNR